MSPKRIERWNGIEISLEGPAIVYARFKHGPRGGQQWHVIPEQHYSSKAELLAYKRQFSLDLRLARKAEAAGQPYICPCCKQEVIPDGR